MRGDDLAKLLLRVTLGVLILFHGYAMIVRFHDYAPNLIARAGLPRPMGYLVYAGEVLGPLLLIVGVWTRPAALLVVINMAVAVLLVHTSHILTLANSGGWALELECMYFVTALAIALLGAGRYSMGGISGRWN